MLICQCQWDQAEFSLIALEILILEEILLILRSLNLVIVSTAWAPLKVVWENL